MKLSDNDVALAATLEAATQASTLRHHRPQPLFTTSRRQHFGVPGRQIHSSADAPKLAPNFGHFDDAQPCLNDLSALQSNLVDAEHRPTIEAASAVSLLFDTGASISCTFSKHDFISPIALVQQTTLKGIASGLSNTLLPPTTA